MFKMTAENNAGCPSLQLKKELCKVLEERLRGTEELLKVLFPQRRIHELIFQYETSSGRKLSIEEWRTFCKRLGVEREFLDRVQSFEIGRNPENIKTCKGGPHLSDQQEKDLCKFLEERLGGTEELLKALFPQRRIYQLIFKYETSRRRPLSIEEWRTLCKRLGVEQEFLDRVQSFEIGGNPKNIKTLKEQLENPNQEEDQSVHVASRAEPFTGTGNSLVSGSDRHLGGPSNAEFFRDNLFSLHSNYSSRNTSTTANNYSLQSTLVLSSHRFARVDRFDGQTYMPSAQQTPYPPMASDPVLNSYPEMTGSSFADPSWTGAALTLPGDPVDNAPRSNGFSSEQLTDPAHDVNRFAGDDNASASFSNQMRSTHDTSVLEPRLGVADNNRVSVLNNRDVGTDSMEASDNSLLALERRVAEACALVERVLREREEREQFGREIEREEQLIREQRARERREREERELREAENWSQQQEAITARSQWLCEHYQRHCRVRFPCCTQFYPCHRCHNISKACDNEEARACHATHLKCSYCQHEQEIGEDSAKCRNCGGKMSVYFCAICKHFTSMDKNPYHCEKCGICRLHQDESFHCEVCNVCLNKGLEGNHKCRPDSGHDECCICLEDAFSGCQILPCSHKVHRECVIAMIQNGIRTCPICRHPLYSQSRE